MTPRSTWILVAHRAGARLFETGDPVHGLRLVRAIEHPDGRKRNFDINSDRPGRSFARVGGARHAMGKDHSPTEQVALRFARRLADLLEKARVRNRFGQLVLVAEPRFLGEIRAALSAPALALVVAEIDKDLCGVAQRDLPRHLRVAVPL